MPFRFHWSSLPLLVLLGAPPAPAQQPSQTLEQPPPPAAAPRGRALSLAEALQRALKQQPQLRGAKALVESARGRAAAARAPLLPQLTANAGLQHTAGTLPQPSLPCQRPPGSTDPIFCTFVGVGLSATQLVWDFHQTRERWEAARERVEVQAASTRVTEQAITHSVLGHFLAVRAQKALVRLARETHAQHERRLALIQGYVAVGSRPAIDLAEARAQQANAWVQVISSQNAQALAQARLHAVLGGNGPIDYELAEETLPPLEGEDGPLEALVDEALRARPEFTGMEHQLQALEAERRARRAAALPSVSASANVVDRATGLGSHFWSVNASLNLSWPVLDGDLSEARVRELDAEQAATLARKEELLQQLHLELEQARLALHGARATLGAAKPAVEAAAERYRLAEGRYATGVGSNLEVTEAQVAWLAAATLGLQAEYNLASARAQFLKALGRPPPPAVTAEAAVSPPF